MIESLEIIDRELLLFINSHNAPLIDDVMFNVSKIWVFAPLFIYWMWLISKKYEFKKVLIIFFFTIILIALTDQSANQVKHAVKRFRPTHNIEIKNQIHIVNDYEGGKYGFFSGHAANSFGIATLLFLLFAKHSYLLRSAFFMWASLTAYSRMYLGVHYPSDIFMGIIVGLFWGFVIYNLIQFIFKKYFNETIAV